MDYLGAMRLFVRSVALGSFSRAAVEAGVKASTVSRAIVALEADLGAALFNRSTRRLHLTEAGSTFLEHAQRIVEDVEEARAASASLNQSPTGLLHINVPGAFGRRHVMPHLPAFLAEYPRLRVDATLTDATVDLIEAGADVAVRIGALADSSLIAKRLAPHRRVLCAGPGYLARAGAVDRPEDLAAHACLATAVQPGEAWYFRRAGAGEVGVGEVGVGEVGVGGVGVGGVGVGEVLEVPARGPLRANDSEALMDAALAGLGVVLLATWLVGPELRAGRLVEVLPGWEAAIAPGPEPAIWGVYPPKRVVSPKVRVFLDFLERRFGRPPYWERAENDAPEQH